MAEPIPDPSPYAQAAGVYWKAGWRGVLPLPPRRKSMPPVGYTGWDAIEPSWPDVQTWIDYREGANVALHLPGGVIGIDVDNYDDKPGKASLETAEQEWGQLPDTWRTTSRDDGVSGIQLFRVPEGLAWVGQLPGGGIEVIHTGHRYSVVWPSVHPEGRIYRWIAPGGTVSLTVPTIDQLPRLPAEWIAPLTKGQHKDQPKADIPTAQIPDWITALPGAAERPCQFLEAKTDEIIRALGDTGSRHSVITEPLLALVRFAETGHRGILAALDRIGQAFMAAVTADRSRTPGEAGAEWARAVTGAVRIVAASPGVMTGVDTCGMIVPPVIDGARLEMPPPSTPPEQPATAGETPAPAEAEPATNNRTTWWPRDLAPVLRGEQTEEPPSELRRADGQHLLYPGRVNGILGPSESGKTWIALEAIRQAVDEGRDAAILDFEDTAPGVVGRLRALGVTDEQITDHVVYISPDEALSAVASGDLSEALSGHHPALILLDGVNAAMTLLGLDLISNKDATSFHQLLLKPLAATGACVITVDHIPKSKLTESAGGIGAQAKRAMTTGAALRVEVIAPFGRGQSGKLKVTIDKDRSGFVRGACDDSKTVGVADLVSEPDGSVVVSIEAETSSHDENGNFRPTVLMERVSEYLAANPEGVSGRNITDAVKGKAAYVRKAIEQLVEEGFATRSEGAGRTKIYTIQAPFDPTCVPASPVRPGASRTQDSASASRDYVVGPDGTQSVPEERGPVRPADGRRKAWVNGHLVDMDSGEILESREEQ